MTAADLLAWADIADEPDAIYTTRNLLPDLARALRDAAARITEYADTLATGARNLGLVTMERDRLRARVEELDGLLAAQRSATDLSRDDIATLAETRAEIREFGMVDDESAVAEAPHQTRALALLDRLLEAYREC